MGLDIFVLKGDKTYHAGYHGLHLIRWEAYRSLGGLKDFPEFMKCYDEPDAIFKLANQKVYKQLFWHSDCEGTYTQKGKIGGKGLLTGNLSRLKKECDTLRKYFIGGVSVNERAKDLFNAFYECVQEAVELKTKIVFS